VGWEGQGIGVRYVNVQNMQIVEQLVQGFAIGVQHTSYSNGCGYNTVAAGYLRNNKVNRQFTVGNNTAWTNRWDLMGGRYFHASAEGVEVNGVMHFDVVPNATGFIINDINHFGGSFEGTAEQYHLRLGGSHINFWGIRLETDESIAAGGIKVHLGYAGIAGQGTACGIHYGRGVSADNGDIAGSIHVTSDTTNNRLSITSAQGTSFKSAGGVVEIRKSTSSAVDFLYCGVDPLYNYGQSIATNYSFGISANEFKGKRRTDVAERIKIDFSSGRTYYGQGAANPTFYIGQQGSSSLGVNANWIPSTNDTHALGATGFAWQKLFLSGGIGAFGSAPPAAKPSVTGSRGGNAALASLITALASYGLITDNTTA
jgi:hypothetical protein